MPSSKAPNPSISPPRAGTPPYEWIAAELRRFAYLRLGRSRKGWLRRYPRKVTGLSRAQMTRLIAQFRERGRIADCRGPPGLPCPLPINETEHEWH